MCWFYCCCVLCVGARVFARVANLTVKEFTVRLSLFLGFWRVHVGAAKPVRKLNSGHVAQTITEAINSIAAAAANQRAKGHTYDSNMPPHFSNAMS